MRIYKSFPLFLIFFALAVTTCGPVFSQMQVIPGIDYIEQTDRNYCGAAALAMLLNHWSTHKKYTEAEIVEALYNPRTKLIYNSDMVYFPVQEGFKTFSFNSTIEEIKSIIDQDVPVIVLQKPVKRVKKGHYRVVFGYDEAWEMFFVHDPMMGAHRGIKYEEFLELWDFGNNLNKKNWTLAILPENKTFAFPHVLDCYVYHLNMATAHYKRKAYQGAVEEWKKAILKNGEDAQAYYCLAQVLLDVGEADEALGYALRAVEVGGEDPFAYDVLGLAYHEKGMYFEAAEAMLKAVKLRKKKHTFILKHWLEIRKSYIAWNKEKKS